MKLQVNKVKVMILTGLIAAVLLAAGVIYYFSTPSGMIAIDVNPSIEIHTNRMGDVVSIDPVNDDAVQLMAGYQLEDRNLETVIKDIVDRMILNGYLVNENTNQILLTANKKHSDNLLNKVSASLNSYLQEKQLAVTVLDQKVEMDKEAVKAAHDRDVSVGKMALINALTQNNSSLNTEEFTHASIKELIQYAISQNISLDQLIQNYNEVLADQAAAISPVPTGDPTAASPTPVVTPTSVPAPGSSDITAAPQDDSVGKGGLAEGTIIISTGSGSTGTDAVSGATINAKDQKASDSAKAKSDKKAKSSTKTQSGNKSYKETAKTDSTSTDAVSGATVNTKKHSSGSDLNEGNSNEDSNIQDNEDSQDNSEIGDNEDTQDIGDNEDAQDNVDNFEENDDEGSNLYNNSRHESDYQYNDNEDSNSQGDNGDDD